MRAKLIGIAAFVAAIILWEIGVRLSDTPTYLVPAPSDVLGVIGDDARGLLPASLVTLGEATAGLVIGATFGLLLATAITFWGRLEQGIMSMALLIKSTPIIAVIPILTIWMGFGYGPKIIVTALLTFFPVLVNAVEGFRSVDPAILEWMRSIDAPQGQMFKQVQWPSARPFLFAAFKVAAPLALVGAVVAEWMGGSSGLGRLMWLSYTNIDMPSLFAAVFALTLLSAGIYRLVGLAERRSIPWEIEAST